MGNPAPVLWMGVPPAEAPASAGTTECFPLVRQGGCFAVVVVCSASPRFSVRDRILSTFQNIGPRRQTAGQEPGRRAFFPSESNRRLADRAGPFSIARLYSGSSCSLALVAIEGRRLPDPRAFAWPLDGIVFLPLASRRGGSRCRLARIAA